MKSTKLTRQQVVEKRIDDCKFISYSHKTLMKVHLSAGCPVDTVCKAIDTYEVIDSAFNAVLDIGISSLSPIKQSEIERIVVKYVGL